MKAGDANVREAFLDIEGMMCGSCAAAVEAVLLREPGVTDAGVNFAANVATVRWNPAKTSLEALRQALAKLGYAASANDDAGGAGAVDGFRRALQVKLAIAVVSGMWSMMAAILLYLAPFGFVDANMHWPLAFVSGVFALPVLVYSGSSFYVAGWRTLRARVPGMDTLISVAVIAATLISVFRLWQGSADVYFDAAVMLVTFQLVARVIDHRVRRDAAKAMRAWLHAAPVRVARVAGERIEIVPASDIRVGDCVRVSAGERVPMDGVILAGSALLDQAMLTGEREPRAVSSDDDVLAGCMSLDGEFTIRVTAKAGQRRIDAIARSVRGLLGKKSALQKLTDRIARVLLPLTVIAAACAALLAFLQGLGATESLVRALAVLIVTCPCALSLAIPLVAVVATARGAASGIIFRDPGVLEAAAHVRTVVFDKTGTITTGHPAIGGIDMQPGFTRNEVLQLAANATAGTRHPVALALATFATMIDAANTGERTVVPGNGVTWSFNGDAVLAGSRRWLARNGIEVGASPDAGLGVHVAVNGRYAGRVGFRESLRIDAVATLSCLRDMHCETWLLSGDTESACLPVARRIGIPPARVKFGHDPEQKRDFLQAMEATQPVLFVGDGMNDGLALAAARLGAAIGDADPTARAAAAVLLPDGLCALPATLALARGAWRTMRGNLVWALGYNAVALPLAVAGLVHPVVAAIAMSFSTVCVLGNSLYFHWGASRAETRSWKLSDIHPLHEETTT